MNGLIPKASDSRCDIEKLERKKQLADAADLAHVRSRSKENSKALDDACDEWVQALLVAWPLLRQEIIDLRSAYALYKEGSEEAFGVVVERLS